MTGKGREAEGGEVKEGLEESTQARPERVSDGEV